MVKQVARRPGQRGGVARRGEPGLVACRRGQSREGVDRVREVDPLSDTMTVEAGVVLKTIQDEAARHDRRFAAAIREGVPFSDIQPIDGTR